MPAVHAHFLSMKIVPKGLESPISTGSLMDQCSWRQQNDFSANLSRTFLTRIFSKLSSEHSLNL